MLRSLRYLLERLLLQGSLALIVVLVLYQALLAFVGGAIAYTFDHPDFPEYPKAVWWAVLRLSDTGYLGDEVADVRVRALSIVLSILGMSATVGGIVAIATQKLNVALSSWGSATVPVPFSGHTVLLGWTDRTLRLVLNFVESSQGRIVLLVPDVPAAKKALLSRGLTRRQLDRVVLRAGERHRPADLDRAGCRSAKCIVVPASGSIGSETEGAARLLRALFALRERMRQGEGPVPTIAVELPDSALAPLARSALPGARQFQSDRVVGRLLRLLVQDRGLVECGIDLLTPHSGIRVEFLAIPALEGLTLAEADHWFSSGHLIGVVTRDAAGRRRLQLGPEATIGHGDTLCVFHEGEAKICPATGAPGPGALRLELKSEPLNILVLGWNEAAPDFLAALAQEPGRYSVSIIASGSLTERLGQLSEEGNLAGVQIEHRIGDPICVSWMPGDELAKFDRFVILASPAAVPELIDVRTLAIAFALEQRQSELRPTAYLVAELLDETSQVVLSRLDVALTPRIAADILESLVFAQDSDVVSELTAAQQPLFVVRVVPKPEGGSPGEWRSALRQAGLAYLGPVPGSHGTPRILCAAPAPGPGG